MSMLREWIEDDYQPSNREEMQAALRETMQQIALLGLYRADFFKYAAFYGGTALRIFYNLPRFSEDLDFSLLHSDPDFKISRFLHAVERECESFGIQVTSKSKSKSVKSTVDSAFINSTTKIRELLLENDRYLPGQKEIITVKIKLEVDIDPPLGFDTEERLLLKPQSCYIKCFSPEDMMAGKMHAVLFRRWKNRVKGRDWFDLEWYIKKGMRVNLDHVRIRSIHSGDWDQNKPMSQEAFMDMLKTRITEVDFNQAKIDVRKFLKDPKTVDIWSNNYFLDLIRYLKIKP